MPFYLLEQALQKQQQLVAQLYDGSEIRGKIVAFDRHFNLVFADCVYSSHGTEIVRNNYFLRGDCVVMVQCNE